MRVISKSACRPAIVLILLLLAACSLGAAYALPGSWQPAPGDMQVEVESAAVRSSAGVQGESRIWLEDAQTLRADLAALSQPGAYVELELTLYNSGTLPATLTAQEQIDCGLEDIYVRFPQLETAGSERLLPGDRCTISLVAVWDPDSARSVETAESGTFGLTLHYTNDEIVFVTASTAAASVPTGDRNNPGQWYLLLICSGFLLLRMAAGRRRGLR